MRNEDTVKWVIDQYESEPWSYSTPLPTASQVMEFIKPAEIPSYGVRLMYTGAQWAVYSYLKNRVVVDVDMFAQAVLRVHAAVEKRIQEVSDMIRYQGSQLNQTNIPGGRAGA